MLEFSTLKVLPSIWFGSDGMASSTGTLVVRSTGPRNARQMQEDFRTRVGGNSRNLVGPRWHAHVILTCRTLEARKMQVLPRYCQCNWRSQATFCLQGWQRSRQQRWTCLNFRRSLSSAAGMVVLLTHPQLVFRVGRQSLRLQKAFRQGSATGCRCLCTSSTSSEQGPRRILAVSDLHVDHPENLEWTNTLAARDHRQVQLQHSVRCKANSWISAGRKVEVKSAAGRTS